MSINDDDDALLNAIIARSNRFEGGGELLSKQLPVRTKRKPMAMAPATFAKASLAARAKKVDELRAPTLPFADEGLGRRDKNQIQLSSVELCAGAGGQALGLEAAGFCHEALVELDASCCATLRLNRPKWNVVQADLREFAGKPWRGVDLLAGGLPCPPFSVAGKQLGARDERNLFPAAIRLIDETRPRAVMFENVRGFLNPAFEPFREDFREQLRLLGYRVEWALLNADKFGVSQLRPRVIIVALRAEHFSSFKWPRMQQTKPPSVGALLADLMKSRGWLGVTSWRKKANNIAPTIVGGSLKHGGPDLGPTRAKKAWAQLGVDGMGIADEAPPRAFQGAPRLTVRMVARIQGFPDDWELCGKKTAAYRQVGNAFPAPVAQAVAESISAALTTRRLFSVA